MTRTRRAPRFSRIFLALLLCIVAVTAMQAQTTTSALRGKVTDESGNAFSTATVTATAVASGYRHDATASADGVWTDTLLALPEGLG